MLQRFVLGIETKSVLLRRMEKNLELLKHVRPVNNLYKNFYKRSNGTYYVSYEF